MILLFFLLYDVDVDLEQLYNKATTRLVSFQAVKDSAMQEFVALGENPLSSDTTIVFLISKFDTKSSVERHTLKNILKEIGIPAISLIVSELDYRGSDGEARRLKQSLWVLGEIGSTQIIEPVARFINDEAWSVRSGAYTALGKSESYEAIRHVLQGLSDTVSLVRKSAFHALSVIATERELPYLLRGLTDDFYGVRYAALSGIRRIKAKVDLPVEQLSDDDLSDYFVLATLDSSDMEYVFNKHFGSASPAARKVMYDMLAPPLLEDAMIRETHPLLKTYLKKRIDERQK